MIYTTPQFTAPSHEALTERRDIIPSDPDVGDGMDGDRSLGSTH